MKRLLIILSLVGIAVGIGLYSTRDKQIDEAEAASLPPDVIFEPRTPAAPQVLNPLPVSASHQAEKSAPPVTMPLKQQNSGAPSAVVFTQALETLLSPTASFQQKQSAWGQLRDSGKLDMVISDLEERMTKNPGVATFPAVLGQAYLQKAGAIQDIREQGILGMKADQSFEAALNSEPENWEARFWKTTAMSYWPPQLGKGKEVIENCLELLKQQEVQSPRPEYAQVYVLLGDMYHREGYGEYAQQTWERGLALFPSHEGLIGKTTNRQ